LVLFCTTGNASGIPTVDIAAIVQGIQEYIGQIMEYAEQAERYAQQMTNWQKEMNNMAGLRELGMLINSIEDIQAQAQKLQNKYQGMQDLLDDPSTAFDKDTNLKELLKKLQVYDNCANIVDAEQKNICYYKFNSQLMELEGFKQDKKDLDGMFKRISEFNSKLQNSDNQKMTLDLIASSNQMLLEMEAKKQAIELANAEMQRQREVDEIRQKQYYENARATPFILKEYDWSKNWGN
jgi:flagellar hook protein FlgE